MPIPANRRHRTKTDFEIMTTTKSLSLAITACALVAVHFNHSAEAKQQYFKPLPIDFYSQMVGRFEALCELVERGDLTPSQVNDQYLEDVRDARDISPEHMINTIKGYLTAKETFPYCTRDAAKPEASSGKHHVRNNL